MVGHKKDPARHASDRVDTRWRSFTGDFSRFSHHGLSRARARRGLRWALTASLVLGYTWLSAAPSRAAGGPKLSEHLPELPAIPSLEVPRPTPADLEELDGRLGKLCSNDEAERDDARP